LSCLSSTVALFKLGSKGSIFNE